jgi:glutathione peroxidase-family protein
MGRDGGLKGERARGARRMVHRLTGRNFTKFLVDKNGKVVGRYGSSTKPEQLKSEIEKLL